ncbi:MAG: 3-phosphoshikimate 1-carboxyvinyltransferase, partial [Candidatus Phytoplasma sp.]|nr:3-phosphoshikimate 1-carboxyvinyltransferase [Phytoplasma sp.]
MIIKPNPLTGEITVISSKSLSHRYVIAAGLSNGTSHISNVLESDDLSATKKALEALNVTFHNEKIIGSFPKKIKSMIEANESGSTLRFMIPIAMLQNEEIIFTGKGKLSERPLNVFQEMFLSKGYTFEYL